MEIRERVRRRVGAYKRNPLFVLMLDINFKSIFSKAQRELGIKEYDLKKIIDNASSEQLYEINYGLDEYQIVRKLKM